MIRIKSRSARKFLAIVANFSLLLNSFFPLLISAPSVFAQDATPTPVVEFTPTPEPENNQPVEEPTVTPEPTVEFTPTPEPPVENPTPTPELTPTIDPVNSEIGTLTPTTEITQSLNFSINEFSILSLYDPVWVCQVDLQGPNDEPGQKDLTQMCSDYERLPETLYTKWNWDDIKWTGSNTGDACNLIDTDNDGFANFSLCVSVDGNPASFKNQALFSCSDTRSDRCSGSVLIASNSSCSASVLDGVDPFPAGSEYAKDTVASCTINMSDFSSENARLIDVCSYPSQQPNSDPSDCIITATNNITGNLEVKKILVPSSDPGKFNLQIDGTTVGLGNVGDGGTTGSIKLLSGNHTVGETSGTDTDLANYTSSISCVDRGLNTFDGHIPLVAPNAGPLTVPVGKDDDIVCTITNTVKTGTLIVKKVVINDNGGLLEADDFSFVVNGGIAESFDSDGQNENTVNAGTYTITEPTVSGYATTYDNCSSITLTPGSTQTCTITNDDIQPKLTVTKIVETGNAQVSEFTLKVDNTTVISGQENVFNAGTYIVSETPVEGYSGTVGGDCALDGSITLFPGDIKTCTITNTRDSGYLKVQKLVDYGQVTDWSFSLDGGSPVTVNENGLVDFGQVTTGSHTII